MAVTLAACATSNGSKQASRDRLPGEIVTKPKFEAGKTYGPASERVVKSAFVPVPRGGGRAVIGKPYKINGRWYTPKEQPNYDKVGIASWYGPNFHGRKTANGEIYDQTGLSAAHPTLPLPSYVKVTNISNQRSVIVRVNDRGPFHKERIIDLSYRTAELLGTRAGGLARVRVEYVGKAPVHGQDEKFLLASYEGPGSVDQSEIAARNKLFAYAGLPPETATPSSPDVPNVVVASAAPVARPEFAPGLTAQTSIPAQPSFAASVPSSPVIVASSQPSSDGIANPIKLVSNGAPLVLQPRYLTPVTAAPALPLASGYSTSTPVAAPGIAIPQARPYRVNAYVAKDADAARIRNIFDQVLINDTLGTFSWKTAEQRTILIGHYADREKAMSLKDELARFGDVSVAVETIDNHEMIRLELESSLPFALKAARELAPGAVITR
ncbi:MAG: septal ring lytic transglycosylase RlpA family protein [Rhizobiales bacterium]|nr:septal ring lytic transglycosylase RlpA family protein [Hyphomicrobiales bacterium]